MKKQCGCGEPIRISSRWNGLEHTNIFENMDGGQICSCPGCGEQLMPKDAGKLKDFTPCELELCESNHGATFNVCEPNGDDLSPMEICGKCASALEMNDGDVLPEPAIINDVLRRYYACREGHGTNPEKPELMERTGPRV